jgi:hypothetical protein
MATTDVTIEPFTTEKVEPDSNYFLRTLSRA